MTNWEYKPNEYFNKNDLYEFKNIWGRVFTSKVLQEVSKKTGKEEGNFYLLEGSQEKATSILTKK